MYQQHFFRMKYYENNSGILNYQKKEFIEISLNVKYNRFKKY